MDYNQTDDRYKAMIAAAVQISPLTAFYHQKHFIGERPFKMGRIKTEEKVAQVRIKPNGEVWFLLNLNRNDAQIMHAVNHEITHIDQVFEERKNKIDVSHSLGISLLSCLMGEGHAYSNEVEGPVMGLLESIEANHVRPRNVWQRVTDKKIVPLGRHTEVLDEARYVPAYLKTLFSSQAKHFRSQDTYEYVVNGYHHDFRYLTENQKNMRKIEARKAVVSVFMNDEKARNIYIGNTIDFFISKQSDIIKKSMQNPTSIQAALCYRDTTMDVLSRFYMNSDELFLGEKEWHQALKRKDKNDILSNIIYQSAHKEQLIDMLYLRGEHHILKL